MHITTKVAKTITEKYGPVAIASMYSIYRQTQRPSKKFKVIKPQTIVRYTGSGMRYEQGTPKVFKQFMASLIQRG